MKNNSVMNKFKNSSNSVKWTVLFAVIAVASILAISLKPVSFAVNTDPAPDSFVTDSVTGTGIIYGIRVFKYTANNGAFQVYCLEYDKGFAANTNYTKGASQDYDYGLNYILRNGYPSVDDGSGDDNQTWVTQVAMWYYLNQLSDTDINSAKTAAPGLWQKVENLVAGARAATDPVDQLSFNINADFAATTDGQYMISNLVTVNGLPSDIFENYDISLDGAPEGTVILNSNGEEMTVLTGLSPTTKFYVRVPIANITNATETFLLRLKGYYRHYRSYKYTGTAPTHQSVVLVEPFTQTLERTVELNVKQKIDVPDTASSSGRAIYFVGLIILLSGAGIIYANIKQKSKA